MRGQRSLVFSLLFIRWPLSKRRHPHTFCSNTHSRLWTPVCSCGASLTRVSYAHLVLQLRRSDYVRARSRATLPFPRFPLLLRLSSSFSLGFIPLCSFVVILILSRVIIIEGANTMFDELETISKFMNDGIENIIETDIDRPSGIWDIFEIL